MPFVSKKQMKFAFANKEKLEREGWDVDEWAHETKGKKLPERVKPRMPKHKRSKQNG